MKKGILLIVLLIAGAMIADAQTCGTGECDCASCAAKKEGGFSLPGLQGLEPGEGVEQASLPAHDHAQEGQEKMPAPHSDHTSYDAVVAESVPHDHDGDGVSDHATEDDHEGHDHDESAHADEDGHEGHECATESVPHDHDGDGVPDHATEDDHEGHDHDESAHADEDGQEGHDHAAEPVLHDHDGDGVPDHATEDDHEGHDHGDEASGGVELSAEMMKKVGIEVHEAERGTVARASIFPAEIKLNRDTTVAVSPRYPSIVRQVFAEIDDTVRKGDVLASLENRETMAVYTVSAPRDGVIISKDLAPGETAGDDRVLFEVADLSSVWADISIFPQYQHQLRKGMSVKFIAHDGHEARGTIRYISPIVSYETRTFTARCVLEGAGEDFTPGAFVRARIHVESVEASVVISSKAVQTLEGEQVVFVPSANGFITAPVKLGLADDRNVQVLSGLHAGDEYVAAGAFALKAQMVTSGMDPHAGHGH